MDVHTLIKNNFLIVCITMRTKNMMHADTRQQISCEYVYIISDGLVIYFDLISFCQEIIGGLLDHHPVCLSPHFNFFLTDFPKTLHER
jgi:DeoR/GlpR family transcriptional regulator of sugar metabolism